MESRLKSMSKSGQWRWSAVGRLSSVVAGVVVVVVAAAVVVAVAVVASSAPSSPSSFGGLLWRHIPGRFPRRSGQGAQAYAWVFLPRRYYPRTTGAKRLTPSKPGRIKKR